MASQVQQLRIVFASMYRSYYPSRDLVKTPYPDNLYIEIWKKCLHGYKDTTEIILNEESFELSSENTDFINQLALNLQVTIKSSAIDYSHGFLLLSLLKRMKKHNPNLQDFKYFETGSACGFSAVVVAKVANDLFKNFGVTTIDVLDHQTKRYWNRIGDSNGRRSRLELLLPYQDLIPKIDFLTTRATKYMKLDRTQRFHLVFLDGQHTYKDVRREFYWAAKNQKVGDIIFLDDVTPGQFDGICKFVREAQKDIRYAEISVDFQPSGRKGFAVFEKIR
jgi:predicted O-methyltransferase YrrM